MGISYNNVLWVVNGSDDFGGQFDLLPGVFQIQNVHAAGAFVAHVSLHAVIQVLGSDLALKKISLLGKEKKSTYEAKRRRKSSSFLLTDIGVCENILLE